MTYYMKMKKANVIELADKTTETLKKSKIES